MISALCRGLSARCSSRFPDDVVDVELNRSFGDTYDNGYGSRRFSSGNPGLDLDLPIRQLECGFGGCALSRQSQPVPNNRHKHLEIIATDLLLLLLVIPSIRKKKGRIGTG